MRCPRCQKESLKNVSYENVPVDQCQTCHGIWLDTHEIQEILAQREVKFSTHQLQDAAARAQVGISDTEKKSIEACPKCSKPMTPMNFSYNSGVVVDICSTHGMWLDHGEIGRLQAFHEHWDARKADIAKEMGASLKKVEAEYQTEANAAAAKIRKTIAPLGFFLARMLRIK